MLIEIPLGGGNITIAICARIMEVIRQKSGYIAIGHGKDPSIFRYFSPISISTRG